MANKRHYHVLIGLPGYMPDANFLCDTKGQAQDLALFEARAFREAGYKVTGNKGHGYDVLHGEEACFPNTTWQTIDVCPCQEDCLNHAECYD